ncbi:MAG: hypothetical protein HHJ13_04725, partial [Phycicoccus sp.]|nr:hypothetical protein [Phycicoccus sp.]
LSTLHGDVDTTVDIPASQAGTTPAVACSGWSDYTEYGTPRDPAAAATVGGDRGYSWLGAKQRSTSATFSAGLTLMGDRLYNATRGLFTSTDPEAGGGTTAYGYPTDPINQFDLNGHCWSWAQKACDAGKKVGHILRFARNAQMTAMAVTYAYVRHGRCSRSEGLTVNCEGVRGANGRGGFTFGNAWMHETRNRDYSAKELRARKRHEARHSTQYAILGGTRFLVAYSVDWAIHHGNRTHMWFERMAGLHDGGYS